jgi:hypothetical protein
MKSSVAFEQVVEWNLKSLNGKKARPQIKQEKRKKLKLKIIESLNLLLSHFCVIV